MICARACACLPKAGLGLDTGAVGDASRSCSHLTPAAHKIRRLGRKARSGIDRTPYKTDRKISFVSYHTRSISMNITRAEAWQLHKAANTAKGDLCRHRDRNPTGGA